MPRKIGVSDSQCRHIDIIYADIQAQRRLGVSLYLGDYTSSAKRYTGESGYFARKYDTFVLSLREGIRTDAESNTTSLLKDRETKLLAIAKTTVERDLSRFLKAESDPTQTVDRSGLTTESLRRYFDQVLDKAGRFSEGNWGPVDDNCRDELDVWTLLPREYQTIDGCFKRIGALLAEARAIQFVLENPEIEEGIKPIASRITVETVDELVDAVLLGADGLKTAVPGDLARDGRDNYYVRRQPELAYPENRERFYKLLYKRFETYLKRL